MAKLTRSDLDSLLDQAKGEGLIVSCYADLSIERGFQSRWLGPFKAKKHEIKLMLSNDHRAWQECQQNLEAIQKVLKSLQTQHARGMAIFSAAQRGFLRALDLDVPVENALVVHESCYLVPLLEVFNRQQECLLVHSDTHRGRLYRGSWSGANLLQEFNELIPQRQHSAGECWGLGQATIAHHRENLILHYHKELIAAIQKIWAEHSFRGIILLGEHEVLEHLRKMLPPQLENQVIHEYAHPWKETPLEIDEVTDLLTATNQAQESKFVQELEHRLQMKYGIAAGIQSTLDALQNGKVGPRGHGYLVMGPDPGETVGRCQNCKALFTDTPALCPRCQAPCVLGNLWEEILLFSLRHKVEVHFVKSDTLSRYGGLAVVLP